MSDELNLSPAVIEEYKNFYRELSKKISNAYFKPFDLIDNLTYNLKYAKNPELMKEIISYFSNEALKNDFLPLIERIKKNTGILPNENLIHSKYKEFLNKRVRTGDTLIGFKKYYNGEKLEKLIILTDIKPQENLVQKKYKEFLIEDNIKELLRLKNSTGYASKLSDKEVKIKIKEYIENGDYNKSKELIKATGIIPEKFLTERLEYLLNKNWMDDIVTLIESHYDFISFDQAKDLIDKSHKNIKNLIIEGEEWTLKDFIDSIAKVMLGPSSYEESASSNELGEVYNYLLLQYGVSEDIIDYFSTNKLHEISEDGLKEKINYNIDWLDTNLRLYDEDNLLKKTVNIIKLKTKRNKEEYVKIAKEAYLELEKIKKSWKIINELNINSLSNELKDYHHDLIVKSHSNKLLKDYFKYLFMNGETEENKIYYEELKPLVNRVRYL